tara:strand:- start:1984 stop:2121 length:138 start_codon:yes stop_codon:yes gene_type:complete
MWYKYLYNKPNDPRPMIEKYPLLPFLLFAGALISTATVGLPVFAG